jgi:hypothetical protein
LIPSGSRHSHGRSWESFGRSNSAIAKWDIEDRFSRLIL